MQVNMRRGLHIFLTLSLLLTVALPVRAHGSTSIQLPIDAAAEAHAAVIASGAPFGDFVFLDDALIGASQYYEVKGEPGSSATWIVVYTYGWGDCPAGCISRHTFVYQVNPVSGVATFDSQQGEALPVDAPEGLLMLEALTDGGEGHGGDGWVHELPKIILAVLLAWVGGAALVGWRKSRANS
jgi:hypothetical protein